MWEYLIEHYDYRVVDSNTIQLYDKKRFVAEINFQLEGKNLWITNLYRTEYGKKLHNSERHYGTEIFAILLIYLCRKGKSFDYILGRLSFNEAEENYWVSSIPYYVRFEQFVPSETGYYLQFYLFADKEAMQKMQPVALPDYKDKEQFLQFVYSFQQEHILQRKDAYFCYVVRPVNLEIQRL